MEIPRNHDSHSLIRQKQVGVGKNVANTKLARWHAKIATLVVASRQAHFEILYCVLGMFYSFALDRRISCFVTKTKKRDRTFLVTVNYAILIKNAQ